MRPQNSTEAGDGCRVFTSPEDGWQSEPTFLQIWDQLKLFTHTLITWTLNIYTDKGVWLKREPFSIWY